MTTVTARSVEERIHDVLSTQEAGGMIDRAGDWPRIGDDERLGEFEQDLRDWGIIYGLCFALERLEDPFEREESVSARAVEVARRVWLGWSSEFAKRDAVDPAIRAVVLAYRRMDDRRALPDDLADALSDLSVAAGT